MAKLRFLFKSHPDDVTLTATSGTPSRMQTGGPSRTWRSDDLAEQEVTAPLGESKNFNLVHLENINTDQALVVQFSDDNFSTIKYAEQFTKWAKALTYKATTLWLSGTAGGDKILDANGDAVLDANGDAVLDNAYNVALPIAAEYMRLVVVDSTNPDGYVEIGRLMAGEYYEAESSQNIGINKTFDIRERSQQIETRGGQFRAMARDPQRVIGVEYEDLHDDDATEIDDDSLVEYLRTVGPRGDILISVYPEEGTDRERLHTVVGRITQRSAIQGQDVVKDGATNTLFSRLTFEVTEVL